MGYIVSTAAANGGTACPASNGAQQSQSCSSGTCPTSVPCAGSWGQWSACSVTCGSGTQTRTYTVSTAAANGGTACPASNGATQSQACNSGACPAPTNCAGSWGSWGACSVTCGSGTQTRTYSVTT